MKQTVLKSKDVNKEIEGYEISLHKKDLVQRIQSDKYTIILVNKKPSFFYYEEKLIPTLQFLQEHNVLNEITVDMGAIKFVVNGADIMRPGITEIADGITKDEAIVIVDENNRKPLAVGIALMNSEEMQKQQKGKSIKNIHYVGDEIWKFTF